MPFGPEVSPDEMATLKTKYLAESAASGKTLAEMYTATQNTYEAYYPTGLEKLDRSDPVYMNVAMRLEELACLGEEVIGDPSDHFVFVDGSMTMI